MCIAMDVKFEIPEDILPGVRGQRVKRSEHFSELCAAEYRQTGLAVPATAGWSVGIWWRVPMGEIWILDALRTHIKTSIGVTWSNVGVWVANKVPLNLNGLWVQDQTQWPSWEIAASQSSGGATSLLSLQIDRNGVDLYYNKYDEFQALGYKGTLDTNCNVTEIGVRLRYYRIPLYDTILKQLRAKQGDDCEVQKLMWAAAPSTFVNQRQDKGW